MKEWINTVPDLHKRIDVLLLDTPYPQHPDWACWKEMVEDAVELCATSPTHFECLFGQIAPSLFSEEHQQCFAQAIQALGGNSLYAIAKGADGLPYLKLVETRKDVPARPVDVLYAVHHRLAFALAI